PDSPRPSRQPSARDRDRGLTHELASVESPHAATLATAGRGCSTSSSPSQQRDDRGWQLGRPAPTAPRNGPAARRTSARPGSPSLRAWPGRGTAGITCLPCGTAPPTQRGHNPWRGTKTDHHHATSPNPKTGTNAEQRSSNATAGNATCVADSEPTKQTTSYPYPK